MSAHTPGPWVFSTDRYSNHIVDIPCAPDSDAISSVRVHLGYSDECEANARLIAAAPELLALLKEYAEAFPYGDKYRYGIEVEKVEGRVTPALAYYRKIAAAIARAEGKPTK